MTVIDHPARYAAQIADQPWDVLYSDDHEELRRIVISGGHLYLHVFVSGTSCMLFVPKHSHSADHE